MEFYIARDKCGGLFLYNDEPIKDNNFGVFQADNAYSELEINPDLFPEITWENSPQQVELVFSKINNKNDVIMKIIGILLILILMIIPINLIITLIKLLTN